MDYLLGLWEWFKMNWEWATPYMIILIDKIIEWLSGGRFDLVRSVLKSPAKIVKAVIRK